MSKQHLAFLAVAVAALAIAPALLKTYGLYLLTLWLVYIIAAMGLNLTVGYAGLKSLCHAGFMGVGAYTVAIMMKAGFSFWLASPVAIVLCFVLGLVIGFPALRVQLHYLGFATLGFNLLLVLFFRSSSNLAAAYGIAVTIDMLITTTMTFFVIRYGWKYPWWLCVAATGLFDQIQSSLNWIWKVKPDPNAGWKQALKRRGMTLALLGAVALYNLPVERYPPIIPPTVTVTIVSWRVDMGPEAATMSR